MRHDCTSVGLDRPRHLVLPHSPVNVACSDADPYVTSRWRRPQGALPFSKQVARYDDAGDDDDVGGDVPLVLEPNHDVGKPRRDVALVNIAKQAPRWPARYTAAHTTPCIINPPPPSMWLWGR